MRHYQARPQQRAPLDPLQLLLEPNRKEPKHEYSASAYSLFVQKGASRNLKRNMHRGKAQNYRNAQKRKVEMQHSEARWPADGKIQYDCTQQQGMIIISGKSQILNRQHIENNNLRRTSERKPNRTKLNFNTCKNARYQQSDKPFQLTTCY